MSRNRFPIELYVLSGLTFLFWIGSQAISPILPLHIIGMGASYMQLGLIMSFFQVVFMIGRLPSGIISSNPRKRAKMLYILMLMQTLTFFLYGLTVNVEILFGVRALEAIAGAFFFTFSMAIVSDIAPSSRRGEAFGIFLTSIGFSLMLGPLISSVLISFLSYHQFFFVLSLFPMLGFMILVILSLRGKFNVMESDLGARNIDINSIRRVLSSRNIILTFLVFFTFSIAVSLFGILFPIYGTDALSFSPSLVSLFFTFLGTTNALFRIPIGRVADRIDLRIPLLFSQALVALVFFLSSQVQSIIRFTFVFALYGVAWATNAVVGSTQIQNHTISEDRGIATALQGMVFDIGGIIGFFVAGVIAPTVTINRIFQISVILPVFGFFAVAIMKKSKKNYTN